MSLLNYYIKLRESTANKPKKKLYKFDLKKLIIQNRSFSVTFRLNLRKTNTHQRNKSRTYVRYIRCVLIPINNNKNKNHDEITTEKQLKLLLQLFYKSNCLLLYDSVAFVFFFGWSQAGVMQRWRHDSWKTVARVTSVGVLIYPANRWRRPCATTLLYIFFSVCFCSVGVQRNVW